MMKTSKIKEILSSRFNRFLLYIFIMILIGNILAVPTADDLGYSFSKSIIDVFQQEANQYMTWTGRSVAHILARTFLMMPKFVFDLFNSACFMVLILMIYKHSVRDDRKPQPLLLLLIFFLVFLFVPYFGQTCLWETGSCNYLWTTTIILIFLYPYCMSLTDAPAKHSKYFSVLFLLAGIAAGWTNENTGGAMILLILLVLLLQRIAHRKTKLWQWMGLVGASAGYLMMISAPGNSVRASEFTSSGGLVYNLIHDFTDSLDVLFSTNYTMHWLFLIYAAVLIAVVYNKRRNQDTLLSLCWIICGIAAVFAIILTPVQVVYDRSMFGASIFVIIAIGICFHRFLQNAALSYHTLTAVFTGVLAVFTCFNLLYTTADLIYTRYQYHKRESYIDAQKEAGNINPVIPLYDREFTNAYNPIYGLGDITIFQDFWTNQSFAKMHELNTISCSTPEQWSKIYQYGDPYLMNIQDMSEYLSAVFENDRYTALVNCSTLDIKQYSSEISILRNFGLNLENQTNFIAVIEKGNISMLKHGNSWLEGYGSIGNYDYYISSGADGLLSDILIDNVEYTNDNPGITIAVFDTEENRIADSVTWNEENETVCTRYMHGT